MNRRDTAGTGSSVAVLWTLALPHWPPGSRARSEGRRGRYSLHRPWDLRPLTFRGTAPQGVRDQRGARVPHGWPTTLRGPALRMSWRVRLASCQRPSMSRTKRRSTSDAQPPNDLSLQSWSTRQRSEPDRRAPAGLHRRDKPLRCSWRNCTIGGPRCLASCRRCTSSATAKP